MSSIIKNRQARFNYEILDTYEAGIALTGSEVKSLRGGNVQLSDAYGIVKDGEAFLVGVHISPYTFARAGGHEPDRTRRLLLHKKEIERIGARLGKERLTMVPLSLYFKNGKVKVELGIGKGKTRYDKRETIKKRDQKREIDRAIRDRR
ncbi:MAG: SsrA-binding protein SmpB [Acidimicrobiia bacterium]|nr:SsrA-binding protein SmpB [Acidimicrobiia bacterium]MBT8249609.1 SsrA-binding protein SmpB [Acidimicrobiia bacterium]NNC42579.1 SsrA-binding protein SmpB [Acidimicrobiia bacterium]NNL27782.1 SsrA-binding protein SmpB [Acidimicrobiia bacterium]NNL47798.1 SsrA-binding protein SmpB [Acidimicrobiia bacterium]